MGQFERNDLKWSLSVKQCTVKELTTAIPASGIVSSAEYEYPIWFTLNLEFDREICPQTRKYIDRGDSHLQKGSSHADSSDRLAPTSPAKVARDSQTSSSAPFSFAHAKISFPIHPPFGYTRAREEGSLPSYSSFSSIPHFLVLSVSLSLKCPLDEDEEPL